MVNLWLFQHYHQLPILACCHTLSTILQLDKPDVAHAALQLQMAIKEGLRAN